MKALRWILGLLVFLVLPLVVPLLLIFGLQRAAKPEIEPGSVLLLDLQGQFVESAQTPLFARLSGGARPTFLGVYSQLRKAARDDRIESVVLRIRNLQIGWGKAQELRQLIRELGDAGKRTFAYLEVESFGANLEYYVASAANGVHVAPGASAGVVGLAAEYLFLGGLWESLGIDLEVERIGAYKTAADAIAGREMTEAHREMANALLDSIDAQFVSGIAASRGLPEAEVRAAIDRAPGHADQLLELGLADAVSQLDQVLEAAGGEPVVRGRDYARVEPADLGFDPQARIALVYGSGAVVVGNGGSSRGNPVLASQRVSEALQAAAEDEEIDAVIFRIDSPGGSALASDAVWNATQSLRESGKPLIASFSDVAASGGYYVAAGADHIVANPGTFTGSIGVFVLRPVLGELFEKLDIGVASLQRGAYADVLLSAEPLSEASRERLRVEIAAIYGLFLERVAAGRRLETESVDLLGRGRVWTGQQAAQHGLVDELGGLATAVARARQLLTLEPDTDVEFVLFPRPKTLVEQVLDMGGLVSTGMPVWTPPQHPLSALARRLEPWWGAPPGAPLLLPPFAVEIR